MGVSAVRGEGGERLYVCRMLRTASRDDPPTREREGGSFLTQTWML